MSFRLLYSRVGTSYLNFGGPLGIATLRNTGTSVFFTGDGHSTRSTLTYFGTGDSRSRWYNRARQPSPAIAARRITPHRLVYRNSRHRAENPTSDFARCAQCYLVLRLFTITGAYNLITVIGGRNDNVVYFVLRRTRYDRNRQNFRFSRFSSANCVHVRHTPRCTSIVRRS